jgi:hypothetical protein
MEAAHVGAFFANGSDADLSKTLSDLAASSQAAIPKPSPGAKLLNDDGTLATPGDDVYTLALFNWYLDADTLRHRYAGQPGDSLAVSTWEYGEEPVMPFATAYAAYFQNSIREERILREARAGSIYAKGGGGTLREIFQDAEENYYARKTEDFTPMIFFDSLHYWDPPLSTTNPPPTTSTIKLDDVIDRVFEKALPQTSGVDWKSKRLFSTNESAILSLLTSYAAETQSDFLMLLSRIR